MNKVNYSLLMEAEIKKIDDEGIKPKLLLHSCCAPCSSAPLEELCRHFEVTVLYYNPNIYPESEFHKRSKEQEKFCTDFAKGGEISFVAAKYDSEDFCRVSKGFENEKELGKRCTQCYRLRLEKCAEYASQNGFDYFTTTLSVSPLKDAQRLNEIGLELSEKYNVRYLTSDFKKKNGYKRSCELSEQFGIYRQDYCGCIYSMVERYLARAKGFIFDVDGTLCDTMGFYETFLHDYLKGMGIEPKPGLRDEIRGFTIPEAFMYIMEEYNIPKPGHEILSDADRILSEFYSNQATLKDGVVEFLEYARSKGIKMCIATATNREYIELMLRHFNIEKYFEFILTSPEVGRGKKFPDIYNISAQRLGCTIGNTIVFEDAVHAVKTAKKEGYTVFALSDKYQKKFEDEIRLNSDIYVDSMSSLINRSEL